MKEIVRWGILSTAHINRRVIPEIQASTRGELIAVASRNQQQADSYANEWQIPRAYGSYEALLEDPEIDVVYIPLPNDMHTAWTIRALHAGKHVLCEKPLCLTIQDLEAIATASYETGKSVMEAFMYVHHPQTTYFKSLIDDGEIGEVVSMYSEFAATFRRSADNYRMSALQGGGALWDVGVYPVSFFQYLSASPVTGVQGAAQINKGIDTNFWGRIDFASGISGQFFASFRAAYSTRTLIAGTTGLLDISHPYNATHECRARLTQEDKVTELLLPKASLYAGEVENMHDVVMDNGLVRYALEDSRKTLETVLKLRESAGL